MNKNIRLITVTAVLTALSVVLAFLKIPVGVGTASFDSTPGFVGSMKVSPIIGGIIGFIGHLATAMLTGFPYGIIIHLIVAASMFGTMVIVGYLFKVNHILALVAGVIANTFLASPFLLFFMPKEAVMGLWLPIAIAATINVVVSYIIYQATKSVELEV